MGISPDQQNSSYRTPPEPGQLVEVRRRQWIVSEVQTSSLDLSRHIMSVREVSANYNSEAATEPSSGKDGAKPKRSTTRASRSKRTVATTASQPSFDFGASPGNESNELRAAEPRLKYEAGPAHAIVEYLKANPSVA